MAWDRNSVMCVTIGATLIRLEQIDATTTFSAIGPMKMSDLQFYNPLASGDINAASAAQLAATFDSVLTNAYGNVYQDGYNSSKAIATMVAVMVAADQTVAQLADAIIKAYKEVQ